LWSGSRRLGPGRLEALYVAEDREGTLAAAGQVITNVRNLHPRQRALVLAAEIRGGGPLRVGDKVSFVIELDAVGRLRAVDVQRE
jgi:hypothetical protein